MEKNHLYHIFSLSLCVSVCLVFDNDKNSTTESSRKCVCILNAEKWFDFVFSSFQKLPVQKCQKIFYYYFFDTMPWGITNKQVFQVGKLKTFKIISTLCANFFKIIGLNYNRHLGLEFTSLIIKNLNINYSKCMIFLSVHAFAMITYRRTLKLKNLH